MDLPVIYELSHHPPFDEQKALLLLREITRPFPVSSVPLLTPLPSLLPPVRPCRTACTVFCAPPDCGVPFERRCPPLPCPAPQACDRSSTACAPSCKNVALVGRSFSVAKSSSLSVVSDLFLLNFCHGSRHGTNGEFLPGADRIAKTEDIPDTEIRNLCMLYCNVCG